MNIILLGSSALTVGAIGIPYILFFVPPGSGGGAGGVPAKDALVTKSCIRLTLLRSLLETDRWHR